MTEHYVRNVFGKLSLITEDSFFCYRHIIETQIPDHEVVHQVGAGIEITKWIYDGKEILRLEDDKVEEEI